MPSPSIPHSPRIGIFVPPDHPGRELLMGITRFVRKHTDWTLFAAKSCILPPLENLSTWKGDGFIGFLNDKLFRELELATYPIINISAKAIYPRCVSVTVNNLAAGALAASHLLERAYQHFAFVGYVDHQYSLLRLEGVMQRLRDRRITPRVLNQYATMPGWNWEEQQKEIVALLETIPKPAAVIACNDVRAMQVLHAARAARLRVPEDLALLGFDDDIFLCEMSDPPLSSVQINPERVGYLAAQTLSRVLAGEDLTGQRFTVPPGQVTVRRSTNLFAVSDVEVAAALRYIRENASKRISVEDVTAATHLSRRTLERRFQTALNRTLFEDIRHVQLERAQQLLTDTDWPIYRIAPAAGFKDSKHLATEFAQHLHTTPNAYRRKHRETPPTGSPASAGGSNAPAVPKK